MMTIKEQKFIINSILREIHSKHKTPRPPATNRCKLTNVAHWFSVDFTVSIDALSFSFAHVFLYSLIILLSRFSRFCARHFGLCKKSFPHVFPSFSRLYAEHFCSVLTSSKQRNQKRFFFLSIAESFSWFKKFCQAPSSTNMKELKKIKFLFKYLSRYQN